MALLRKIIYKTTTYKLPGHLAAEPGVRPQGVVSDVTRNLSPTRRTQAIDLESVPVLLLRHITEDECDVEESGLYSLSPEYFEQYWSLPTWSAHLLHWEGSIAGFALIEDSDALLGAKEIADLFIMKRFRRCGIAQQVVLQFMSEREVPWTVVVFNEAIEAKAFWNSMFQLPALAPSRQISDPDDRDVAIYVLEPTLEA